MRSQQGGKRQAVRKRMHFWTTAVLAFCLLLVTPASARAYLDPGSGSMVVQLFLGGLAGLAVLIKMFWRRFIELFKRGR